jgi:hypothetical protein
MVQRPLSDKLGLLQIYIDEMLFPVISLPINLAKMVNPDTHRSTKYITKSLDMNFIVLKQARSIISWLEKLI